MKILYAIRIGWILLACVGYLVDPYSPGGHVSANSSPLSETHVVIVNSGSLNTCPYTIDVVLNGTATYTVCQRHGSGTLGATQTIQFFNHVLQAMPLDQLPQVRCLKPISFATDTSVRYAHQQSPDISCPSKDSRISHLFADAQSIQHTLGFSTIKRPISPSVMAVRVPRARSSRTDFTGLVCSLISDRC